MNTLPDPPPDDLRCARVRLLLSLALDDAATAPQRDEIDAHLPGCADCRAAADADRLVRARLAEPAVVPEGFRRRVLAAAVRRAREARAQNRLLLAGAAAAAFLAVVTAVVGPGPAGPAPDGAVAHHDGRARARTALITSLAAHRLPVAAKESPR